MHLSSMISQHSSRRRLPAFIAAGLVLALLIGVGVIGLVTGPHAPDAAPTPEPGPSPSATAGDSAGLPVLEMTSDPEVFARSAAEALFTWDTTDGLMPLDYSAALLASGDPSGDEQAGLAADIATYFPTRDAWQQLRLHAATQTLAIDHAYIPDAWASALAQGRPGQIVPGTVAVTIDGTRHRTGTWNNQPIAIERPVALTVFVLCPPATHSCRLLRLSAPDSPLH